MNKNTYKISLISGVVTLSTILHKNIVDYCEIVVSIKVNFEMDGRNSKSIKRYNNIINYLLSEGIMKKTSGMGWVFNMPTKFSESTT